MSSLSPERIPKFHSGLNRLFSVGLTVRWSACLRLLVAASYHAERGLSSVSRVRSGIGSLVQHTGIEPVPSHWQCEIIPVDQCYMGD